MAEEILCFKWFRNYIQYFVCRKSSNLYEALKLLRDLIKNWQAKISFYLRGVQMIFMHGSSNLSHRVNNGFKSLKQFFSLPSAINTMVTN